MKLVSQNRLQRSTIEMISLEITSTHTELHALLQGHTLAFPHGLYPLKLETDLIWALQMQINE